MRVHPLAEMLPSMTVEQFEAFKADVKANGLLMPITTLDGAVLDGRHRLRACDELGIDPRFVQWQGTDEQAAHYVTSMNVHRRNLNKAQLGLVGAKLKAWFALRAKERQLAALETSGKRGGKVQAHAPEPISDSGQARDLAARAVGVGGKTIDQGEAVSKSAIKEVIAKVEGGEMSMREAVAISVMSKERQLEVVAMPIGVRKKMVDKSRMLSSAKKKQAAIDTARKRDYAHLQQAADAPGSANVRFLLSRLEVVTVEIGKSGLTAQQYADRFVQEFDWADAELARRLRYVSPAIEAIASLAIIGQRAVREAA